MNPPESPTLDAQAYFALVLTAAEMCCRRSEENGLSVAEFVDMFCDDVVRWTALMAVPVNTDRPN